MHCLPDAFIPLNVKEPAINAGFFVVGWHESGIFRDGRYKAGLRSGIGQGFGAAFDLELVQGD